MQGSKRSGYWGRHSKLPTWTQAKKRLEKEFFFDSKRLRFYYFPGGETFSFILDKTPILVIPCINLWENRKGNIKYYSDSVLKIINDYFNVEKSNLFEYNLDSKIDPDGIHLLLKCADKRIGVRRLRQMYFDLFIDGLLDGVNVKPAIKILQIRIKTKDLCIT